jgi:hypothetical protein
MMLGFVVRRCTVDLGHRPSPAEFADWANSAADHEVHVFGRPISEAEASLILRHQARLVTARSAEADEEFIETDEVAATPANVVQLADLRARRAASRGR